MLSSYFYNLYCFYNISFIVNKLEALIMTNRNMYKCFISLFLLLFSISCFACPGCSMFNITTSLKFQEDVKWAYVIVFFTLAIPVILILLGFNLKKTTNISKIKKWMFTIILFLGWIFMGFSGFFAPNYGIFLMHWFYFPMVIQFNIFMVPAFYFPILLIPSGLIIPGIYCYYLSSSLLKYHIILTNTNVFQAKQGGQNNAI